MKLRTTLLVGLAFAGATFTSHGAQMIISNVNGGPGVDTLYASNNNALMNGGVVAMGYFPAGILDANVDTIPELQSNLGSFTMVTSVAPGSSSVSLTGSFPGYAEQTDYTSVSGGLITPSNNSALLGRTIYEIVSNASSWATVAGGTQYSLLKIGTFLDDGAFENQYGGDPANKTILIGTTGSFTGDAGAGQGTYTTLKMGIVPEASTTLLGALGALVLLRRRRN